MGWRCKENMKIKPLSRLMTDFGGFLGLAEHVKLGIYAKNAVKVQEYIVKKLMRDNRGLAIHLTRQLDSVLSSGSLESFPRQLDIVEQGEFLLALHQQRQNRYEKKGTDGSAEAVDQEA